MKIKVNTNNVAGVGRVRAWQPDVTIDGLLEQSLSGRSDDFGDVLFFTCFFSSCGSRALQMERACVISTRTPLL